MLLVFINETLNITNKEEISDLLNEIHLRE